MQTLIGAVEATLDGRLKVLKKARAVVSGGRKKLEKAPGSQKVLERFVKDLDSLPGPADAGVAELARVLKEQLREHGGRFERQLRDDLQAEAERAGLPVGSFAGELTVGPFSLAIDIKKEAATLSYAKVAVEEKLPLDAARIVGRAAALAKELLEPPADTARLAAELEEAVRVAAVREGRPVGPDELRADLPAVFREMTYVRQTKTRPLGKTTVREYPLARFVVEVKTLMGSDHNMSAARRFRLETAVIENTRNAKKSVYLPAELEKGYGEGTYFQAIVLTAAV